MGIRLHMGKAMAHQAMLRLAMEAKRILGS